MSASAASATSEPPAETTQHEKLVERARSRDEPSRTKTLRQRYAQNLRGQLAGIRAALREGVVENDAFGLQTEVLADAPGNRAFEFSTNPKKVDAARRWLERQLENDVIAEFGGENQYIEKAYLKGLEDAQAELSALGIGGEGSSVAAATRLPIHREQLETLYARNLSELESLTDDITTDVRRELSDGIQSGDGARDIASDLSDIMGRVDDGTPRAAMNRATMIARTELMNSHNWGRLQEWERAGVTKVDVLIATDACPQCQAYKAGAPYEASEAYGNLPRHPNCRCSHTIWTRN